MKTIQLLLILLSFSGIAQTEKPINPYDTDKRLRACLLLDDTTAIPYKDYSIDEFAVFRFRIHKMYMGRYDGEYVYVAAPLQLMRRFNPQLRLRADYWWIVRKTEDCYGHDHIYRVSGGF